MKTQFKLSHLNQVEELISRNRVQEAQAALLALSKKKIPREDLAAFSRLARRVNLMPLVLRLLNPIVRSSSRIKKEATIAELVEYATALIWNGSSLEAKWLIKELDLREVPEASLALAYAHMFEWDYKGAIPYLESYLSSDLVEFDRLVGETNLAACCIRQRDLLKAEALLAGLRNETQENYFRLYANALELSAQVAIFSGNFREADTHLKSAKKILNSDAVLDSVLIQKWSIIKELNKSGPSKKLMGELESLKKKALKFHHWETIRECDKYAAVAKKDSSLFLKVYFGTPYQDYRDRLITDFKKEVLLPRTFAWRLNPKSKAKYETLDLFSGEINGKSSYLKSGKISHRILYLLTSDFYKPLSLGNCFGGLFPGEYYNPESSPHRIHQAVSTLNKWLKDKGSSLSVTSEEMGYRLTATSPVDIYLTEKESRRHPQMRLLFDHFKTNTFSVNEAATALSVPLRSLQRFLSGMVEESLLTRTGASRSLRYQIKRNG